MSSKTGVWKRDNLRIRFPSARSIEETGLDSSRLPSEDFSPHGVARRMFGDGSSRRPEAQTRKKQLGTRNEDQAEQQHSKPSNRRRHLRNKVKLASSSSSRDLDRDVESEVEGSGIPNADGDGDALLKREDGLPSLQNIVLTAPMETDEFNPVITSPSPSETAPAAHILEARNRWRRLRHTVLFANHMANLRNAPADLLEEKRVEEMNEGAGGVGAAAFEGSKTGSQPRLKGRRGMEGLVVRQDKSLISFIQDFYVACLKMPIGFFLVGVFLAPVALGLIFTPLYLINVEGLTFDESMGDQGFIGSLGSVKEKCFALLSVFLYSLSLSTTFGGSPVNAVSPYCLLLANVNTLMAQFLFVFLSGAVFARMSQPSHPIRCSKKAIVRKDDYIPTLADGEKLRVLGIRIVLTGPPPCELVDAKICLTFRIFVTLPSGSMFCSTQDLELVRPEVSYLRYGLMVRHIIDKKSPVYGHTLESLTEGDASFSLTVMGLERASMQPIFHLEDYFVYDGDIIWDGDYMDFIHINATGQRVLDHSKIDLLRSFKATGHVSKAVTRMKKDAEEKKTAQEETSPLKRWVTSGLRNRKLWKGMSASFTRACGSG